MTTLQLFRPGALVAGLGLLLAAGCASDDASMTTDATADPARSMTEPASPSTVGTDDLERRYVVGPTAARELGYRINWQVDAESIGDVGLPIVEIDGDAIFAVDANNRLSRFRWDDGQRLWRIPAARPLDEVQGVSYVPSLERLYLSAGGTLMVMDAVSGAHTGRQRLDKVANTAAVQYGPYLIYGARNGQAIWHSHEIAFFWRAYQVSPSIVMRPLLAGNTVTFVGADGRVMVLDADSASQRWSKTLLETVVARPDIADDILYVACRDQYLYAFDLGSGQTLWRRLTTSPLVDRPRVFGDHVYQNVPGEGMHCFVAYPPDAVDGELVWTCPEAAGEVITRRRHHLLAWDQSNRRMTMIDARSGAAVGSVSLPQVHRLEATSIDNGTLLAVSADGRMQQLVPRN